MTATDTVLMLQRELGHVMGLGHVTDPLQHMYPAITGNGSPPLQWGAGDLTGLRKVGLTAGRIR